MNRRCAFLTLDEPGDFVIDDVYAAAPLNGLGWRVDTVSWRQSEIPWTAFDAVIIRSTWDYWNDVPAFLDTLARISRLTRLANPLDLVHWNLAKTYLRDLQGKGVAVVPTLWPEDFHPGSLVRFAKELQSEELVVKPVVGANGEDAYRFTPGDDAGRLREIAGRFRGRACMIQPFMRGVVEEGEYSLFYFSGAFSHAILKVPAKQEFRSQEERGATIHAARPESAMLARGARALEAVVPAPLYARVDLVRNGAGDFAVMELELIEPSLYLRMDAGAPDRFAHAIDRWFGRAEG